VYTAEDLEKDIETLETERKEIRLDRGKRYGSKEDVLFNISTFGSDGAIISFWECAMRIKNMFGKEKNLDDLRNAVLDGCNYLQYIYILEERKEDECL